MSSPTNLTCKGTSKICYKEPIFEVLSGCLHFGPFSHRNYVHIDPSTRWKLFSLNRSNGVSKNPSFYCETVRWLGGRGRVSYTFRYLRAHKFQKTELIVAHSLQCWAIQSMVDSIKGLASTLSSSMMMSLEGIAHLMFGTLYSTVSKICRDLAVYTV
jgi:hypothetical protein